ncbi:MAG: CDP-alcohol phosphatidyltransferase family protein [Pyrinomonadaceae bacterium]
MIGKFGKSLANIVTLSRIVFACLFSLLFEATGRFVDPILLSLVVLIFISDIIDGGIARKYGSVSSPRVGSIFDSTVDTFVIISLSFCYFTAGLMSFSVTLLVIWVRVLITGIRLLAATVNQPYPATRILIKIKGWSYGLGMLYLTLIDVTDTRLTNPHTIILVVLNLYLGAITILAFADFIYHNRKVLSVALFPSNLL